MDLSNENSVESSAVCLDESEENTDQENMSDSDSKSEPNANPSSPHDATHDTLDYDKFIAELNDIQAPEEKIPFIISFMEKSISQGNSPSFKFFWDARKLCMDCFKDKNLPYAVRSHLWGQYVEISKEAFRLKELLDEESAFAAEQIDLAIQALEMDIEKLPESQMTVEPSFDIHSTALKKNQDAYIIKQTELNFLNAFASRINSLRKELIKTEMRIRFKNSFFQRLSTAGDRVFPRRKELIKDISHMFLADVEDFIQENFSEENMKQPLYVLRDQIKNLQGIAKILTLNTQAFNKTRMNLSECWDKVKRLEKDRKKEKAKFKAQFKENREQVDKLIAEYEELRSEGSFDENKALKKIDEISSFMRQVQLSREDVKELRQKIQQYKNSIKDSLQAANKEKMAQEAKKNNERLEKFQALLKQVDELTKLSKEKSIEEIQEKEKELTTTASSLNLSKWEKHDFDKRLQSLHDTLAQKKIENLPADDKQAYDQLKNLLSDCNSRKHNIKEQLEIYRKANGSSGLDMEQALKQREMLDHEKERMEQVDQEINKIMEKMNELEGK